VDDEALRRRWRRHARFRCTQRRSTTARPILRRQRIGVSIASSPQLPTTNEWVGRILHKMVYLLIDLTQVQGFFQE
jgi:hypothetical protein